MEYRCQVCDIEIHPKRVQLGYKYSCPAHSKEKKFTAHLVVEGKCEYSVQVIKDDGLAKDLQRLSRSIY